jgi:GNAT superfamily N-acetyltransferase
MEDYNMQPAMTHRDYRDDADFWRIRQLAIDSYALSGPGYNWDIRHWDGEKFYDAQDPTQIVGTGKPVHVWETADRQIAGAVICDSPGWPYPQVHPDYRSLEAEMIAYAEEHMPPEVTPEGRRQVHFEVFEYDAPRKRILTERGYQKMPYGGVIRVLHLGKWTLPEVRLDPGYSMREIRPDDLEDTQRLADLLNASFRRTFHNRMEFYHFAKYAPSFRTDLHLVAVAPDGSFAAHAALTLDATNRQAIYEPVCTHPEHRRHGLAQTLMFELMHRAKALGAMHLSVETGDMEAANALYDSIGFSEVYKSYAWKKVLE